MTITALESDHITELIGLFERLPESDLTFIKEDVSAQAVEGWLSSPGQRWVHVAADGSVVGFGALRTLSGWSDHVGELRLVVDPATRGQGVGRSLALHGLSVAIHQGKSKVIVELPAAQERTIEMFLRLGFTGEALLRDHFRDRSGQLQDLIMLAHFSEQNFEAMRAAGVASALEAD